MSNSENDSYLITSEIIVKWTEPGLDTEVLNAELIQIIDKHPAKMFPIISDDARKVFKFSK